MRLLFLVPNPPSPRTGGGSLRMYHLLRFLGQRYEVDVVGPALTGVEEAADLCRPFCADMEWVPAGRQRDAQRLFRISPYEADPALASAVRRRLATNRYAAVQVEKPAMLPYLPTHTRLPVILDTWAYGLTGAIRELRHSRGVLNKIRPLIRLARFGLFDAFCWPDIACILVVSEVDRARAESARKGSRVLVVPNGVDCGAFPQRSSETSHPPTILFTGDMSFGPNVEAAYFLATRVFPVIRHTYPEVELSLVGRNPTSKLRSLEGSGIKVTGEVPDMNRHLRAATLFVAPLFTGAGTRTKLLEAMAVGLPIVTTTIGIEGLEARHGREVMIADDLEELLKVTRELLQNKESRTRLGKAARELVERRYDWSHCLKPLDALYTQLLPKKVA